MAGWRSGATDVNARHTALHERLAGRLASTPGWVSAAEVSFSIWGERGVIDRLAFHSRTPYAGRVRAQGGSWGSGRVDRSARPVPPVGAGDRAREGLEGRSCLCWAVVADTDTNRRRLAAHRDVAPRCVAGRRRRAPALAGRPIGAGCDGLVFSRISAPTDRYAEPLDGQAGSAGIATLRPRVTVGAHGREVRNCARPIGGPLRSCLRVRRCAQIRSLGLLPCLRAWCCAAKEPAGPGSVRPRTYIITRPPSTASTWPVM